MPELIHINEPEHSWRTGVNKAKAVLHDKPDVILFERPENTLPDINKYKALEKPEKMVSGWANSLGEMSKHYPWLSAEVRVIVALRKLWCSGHDVLIYAIDGPMELTSVMAQEGVNNIVWNFLREQYMLDNIVKYSREHSNKKIMIFLHNFHWKNIQFLKSSPSNSQIFNHYFSGYSNVDEVKNKITNPTLLKFWKKKSPF